MHCKGIYSSQNETADNLLTISMQYRIIDSLTQTIIYRAWVAEATIARYAGRGLRRAQNTMDQEVANNTRISSDSKSCCTVQNLLYT